MARQVHQFPGDEVKPARVVIARLTLPKPKRVIEEGIAVVSQLDIRGDRCDIKSIGSLPSVLVKEAAREQGAYEARQIDHVVFVTEGGSANAWIINAEGQFVTRQAEKSALNGITRRRLIELAKAQEIKVQERPFTLDEIKLAGEAF